MGIFSLGRPRRPHQRSAPPIKFRRLRQAVAYSVESLERRVLLSQYVVTDLGTLGGTSSNAYGINDSLQITGSASTATQSHAFLYSGGSMSDLGLFSGVTNSTSVAFGLNSGGQVVGLSYTGNQQVQHAFRDVGGTMFDIGTPGGLYSVARGINATGQIVGYGSTVGQGDASTGNYGIYHAFVYDTTNGLRDIGTLGGDPISSATGINDSGLVAAASYNGNWRGFIYNVSTTTKTPLQTLGGSQVDPVGINNNGQLAGWSTTAGGQREAFLYTIAGGTILPLGDLGGNDGIAWSLNNAGTVVGQSDIAGSITHAFVYAGGAMADLNSLIPAGSGWVLNAAQSINNNGQIVGYGTIGGQSHAFLLSPGPPSVVSINRSAPATAITAATTVSFAVTFDQTVSGVDPTDFKVVAGGSAAYAGPLVVAGSGSSYTVTINGIHGSGTLQLELVDDDSIKNGSNTPLGGPGLSNGSFMGQSCTILQTYPTVISINRANPVGPSTTANTVSYTVTFSAPVTGVIATDFALSLGGVATTPPLVVTPVSSSVYTVTVNGVSSSGTLGLNLIDNGAIHDFSGNPLRSLPATSASFQAQRTTSVIPVAASVAEADLNGDGKLDVVVNKSVIYNGVSALLGNGDGTFQPARNIAATITSFVTIADVNGDGIPDLATANNGYNNVSVLLGNGDGTFKSQRTFAAGANARCLAVADMNGDGKLDLVTCNYTDNTVSVLLGNGDGTFQSQRTVSVGSGPYSLALADINGDGKTDVAVANRGVSTTSTSVLLGNGDGTFQAQQTIALGARQNAVALADLNGDGKLDLVSGLIGSVGVLLGNGNGTFQAAQTFATGATTGASLAVAVSDVNEDGKPDLVMANGGNETLGILLGNGDGTFRAAQTFAAGMQVTTVGQFTFSVAVGDANGDGKPDLVSANGEPLSSSVSVLLNTGLGAFHGQIYTIQQILPTVLSVNRGTPVGPITSASGVNFTVTFNEAVTGVDPTDFQVVTDGSAAASAPVVVTPVSGSVYTVTLNGVHGNGTVGLNLVDNGSIRDLNGNALQSSAAGAFAFQAQQTFAAGPRPFSVVPADLNADGKPDLVLSDQSGDYVGVLLGNGNGTFQVQQTFASGAGSSYSVASADLNGDGRVDVVSANFTGNTVSVLLGNGNGTLQAPQSFATGARPDWIALADVNGDGKIDLIVANANGNTASVLLGNGNGTFQAQQTFAAGANPWTLAVADANGDGKPDLLVADYLSNSVSVLLGNGDGTFQAAQPYAAGANPYFITASDLNADGIPDLVVANFKGANVSVLLGNGNGSFLAQQTFAVGTKPRSIATADVNGDGRQDLIVGDYSNNTLSVLLGNGNGTFQAQQTLNTGAGSGPWGIAAADLNGDGKVDLIAADLLSASVSVILNGAVGSFTGQTYSILQTFPTVLSINRFNPVGPSTSASSVSYTVTFSTPVTGVVADDFVAVPLGGASYTAPLVVAGSGASYTVTVNGIAGGGTLGLNLVDNGAIHDLAGNPLQSSAATSGTFAPQQTYGLSSGPQIVVATDVNGDGKSDLIVTNANGSTVSVLLGNGDGTFQAQRTFAVGVGDWPVGVADVNGDGKPDLIVGFNSSAVGVLLGNGDGSFQAERTFATGSLGGLRSATVADLNGDGKSDLVIMSFAGPLSVLLGNGDGTFRAQGTFATGGGQCYIAIADVNGDSKPDVVVTNPTSNAVGVLLGNGDGTFQAQLTFSTGLYSGPVAVSDVNGDGRSDLVVGNFHTNSVSVLLGNGNGSFQAQRTFTTGPYPSWVAIADVNGDGKPDLIAANNAYGNNVSVLLGNGDGTFAAQLTFACGTHVNAVAVSDFNGDGKPDLVVTNFGSNTVSVLLGNGADSFTGQLYTILAANKLGFATPPSNTTYGTAIDSPGGVQVAVQDSNGNTVAGDTSTVALSLHGGTFVGGGTTVSIAAVNGIATFNNLLMSVAGTYSLTASDGSLSPVDSVSFTVIQATPVVTVSDAGGTYNTGTFPAGDTVAGVGSQSTPAPSLEGVTPTLSYYIGTFTTVASLNGQTALPGAPAAAGSYTVLASFVGSADYIAIGAVANFTIARATLTVTATGINKVYDGTVAATATLSDNHLGGDTVVDSDSSAVFSDKLVGAGKPVSVSGISISGASAANYTLTNATASAAANITARSLSVSATGVNKVYDGTTAGTVSQSDNRVAGDSLTTSFATATFVNKNVGIGKTLSVTGISVTGTDAGNYTFNATASTAANVTARSLTVTATAINKVYDGTTAGTVNLSDNRVAGDSLTNAYTTATFSDKNVGIGKTVSVSGISVTGTDSGNYTFNATASTTANITARSLTVTAAGVNRVYDGTTAGTVNLADNRVAGDSLTDAYTTATFADKNVGIGKTVSVTGISVSGSDSGNYTFNPTASTTANITARSLTVSATGVNKVYDGTTAGTVNLSDNKVAGDSLTDAYTTATFSDKNVGIGKAVSVSGIGVTGTDSGNYTFNPTASATANITARSLTVTATGVNKVYDGTTSGTVNLSDNRVAGDSLTDSYTAATFANKNVGIGKTVSVSGINVTGTDSGNYTFNATASTAANITARALTVTATGVNKVYDGTTAGTVNLSDNRVAGDSLTDAYTTATFADKNVGVGKTVSVTGISVIGTDSGNYTFNATASTTANLTARALTVTATGVNKVYDGTTGATVNLADNRVVGDSLTDAYTTATFADKNVAIGKTVSVSGIGVTGTDSGNYTFNATASATANITARALIVTATGINKVYDGTTAGTVNLSDNRVAGDALTDAYTTATFADKNVGVGKTVSVSGITLGGADAPNYSLSNTTASAAASITARPLHVTATGINKIYDGTTSATVTLSDDRVAGETLSSAYTSASFADRNVGTGKAIAVGGITFGGADSGNYVLANSSAAATANISARSLAVTATAPNRVYDGTIAATASLTDNRLAGDVFTDGYLAATFADKNVGTGKTVTISGISLSGADAGNYTCNVTATAIASVTRRSLTVTAIGQNKPYDGSTSASVVLQDDRLSGDQLTDTYAAAAFADPAVGNGKTITVTGIAISGPDAGNYNANTTAVANANIFVNSLTMESMLSLGGAIGIAPQAGLTLDTLGNLYGTTYSGGPGGDGTVFKVSNGILTTLAVFNGNNGSNPQAALLVDATGNLYGTTVGGGAHGLGTVFKVSNATLTTLASFSGNDGSAPQGGLLMDGSGNLFGTASGGGASGHGVVFKIAAGSSTISPLASFTAANGATPAGSLVFDAAGNLWGTTRSGGTNGAGTLFEITVGSSAIIAVANFGFGLGSYPDGGLLEDAEGNFFGTTRSGGDDGLGTVFEFRRADGALITAALFTGSNGANPSGGLVMDPAGNLYGASASGGGGNYGCVFELAKTSGTLIPIASFDGSIGAYPVAAPVLDVNGNFFLTTQPGGSSNTGALVRLVPPSLDVVRGTVAQDSFTLTQDPDHQHVDWTVGNDAGRLPVTDPRGLTLIGVTSSDTVTLNNAAGNPLPNSLHLDGTFTITGMQGVNPLAGTTLEIGQSTVYVNYASGPSPVAAILAALGSGYNGGGWNGSGSGLAGAITSTAAASGSANTFGVGFADSADGTVVGQPINTVEIRYTVMGDANLDRVVNSADAILMGRNYLIVGRTNWDLGNFNYDTTINLSDAVILQKNFNATATGSVVATTAAAMNAGAGGVAPISTSAPVMVTTSSGGSGSLADGTTADDTRGGYRQKRHGKQRGW